jgi:glycosyltransferase involved in cell wall biosynthesis
MNAPLVSIVVNNYNNEPYLKDCLDSLIAQTYRHIEIVVVDAFSSDNSRTLLDEYARRDDRVKLVYTESYVKYPSITYNLGFLNCSGDFIAVNDADDMSMPTRIEKQLGYLLDHPDIGVVGCNCVEFNDSMERIVSTTVENNVRNAAPPARNPSLMFRKSVAAAHGLWRWQCEYAADFEWLYRWYTSGVRFVILEEPLIRYRYSHGGNISNVHALNQSAKVAIFRTYFGLKMFKSSGVRWWLVTSSSYYYVASLSFKWCLKIVSVWLKRINK